MTNTLPDPLTPPGCDLRGLEYMPLLGARLFSSDFNAGASDGEWRAAVTLWWAAWCQVPAGSLPADDVVLCRLADLGRDMKTWKKVKERALSGFAPCSDGRLYHAVLCEQALIAWDKRGKERDRKAKWRMQKTSKSQGQDADVPRDKTVTPQGQDADVPADETRRDETLNTTLPSVAAASPPEAAKVEPVDMVFGLGVPLLTSAGVTDRNARSMLGLQRKTHGDLAVIDALQRCAEERPLQPVPWLQAALKAKVKSANRQAAIEDENHRVAREWANGSHA